VAYEAWAWQQRRLGIWRQPSWERELARWTELEELIYRGMAESIVVDLREI